jgi:signal transduction histidine kinase
MTLVSVGIVVAAIFFVSMGATAWTAIGNHSQSLRQGRVDQVTSVGAVLAKTAEIMMATDELSAVRRSVSEAALEYDLQSCRIVLPDGSIIADASPKRITLSALPDRWDGAAVVTTAASAEKDTVCQDFVLEIPGRGQATLQLIAAVTPPARLSRPLQSQIGLISAGALVALLLLHRSMRLHLRGICAVRHALLTHEESAASLEVLEVTPNWGAEAQAWNQMIHEQERQRELLALRNASEGLRTRRSDNGDLQAVCNALWQGLILVDKDLRAKYANGAAAVLLQVDREDLNNAPVADLIGDPKVIEATEAATQHPMRRRTIVESERQHGEAVSVLRFIVRPVRREDPGVAMIVIEDITQQRVAERSRGAFIANATHELRTPLTNIRLYAETGIDSDEQSETTPGDCLNVINQEAHRLERMVADILSVAQIEAGTLQLKKDDVRLAEVLADLQNDYLLQAKDKDIDLAFNLPPKLPVISADRDKLIVGLHNLLSNALKYTPAGGSVTVTVTADDGQFVTNVTDTGIGMSEQDADRVFEKFYRSHDQRVTGVPGSGLGLAIAREAIRLHGGDITLQTEIDKGSTFRLSLPIEREAA